MKASNEASDKQAHHLVLTVSPKGKISASVTHNLLTAFIGNANLFDQLSS